MKVFFHCDEDGCCSGYWVRKLARHYDNYDLKFYEINYGMEFPFDEIREFEQIYIVDYSILPEEMERLLKITEYVTWIDHHGSAIKRYENFPYKIKGIRYDGIAGCELTYCYLRWLENPTDNVLDCLKYRDDQPLFSKYIGDFDVWKFEYGEEKIKAFEKGLSLMNTHPESSSWDYLIEDFIKYIIEDGYNIIDYEDKQNENFCKHKGFECEFEGLNCFALNMPGVGSDHFKSLKKDYDMWIGFSFDGERWTYALRSKFDHINCAEIAMKYGGGGHKGAAGFSSDELLIKK